MGFPSLYVLSALIEADALICGGQPRDALVVLSNLDEKIETDANRLIWVFLWLIARSALGKSTSKMDEFTALLNHVGTVTWDTRGIQEWKQSRIHDAKAQAFVEDLIGRLNAKQPRVMKCYELMGCGKTGCVMRGVLDGKRCWEIDGTLCNINGTTISSASDGQPKALKCSRAECPYYLASHPR